MNHSVYEYVVYDSEVEKEFARKLDQREDIKLFVKLPGWFEIDTPVGKYNPDWAIVKHDGQALYLVRETKSTNDFLKLRTARQTKSAAAKSTSRPSACRFQWSFWPMRFDFQWERLSDSCNFARNSAVFWCS